MFEKLFSDPGYKSIFSWQISDQNAPGRELWPSKHYLLSIFITKYKTNLKFIADCNRKHV